MKTELTNAFKILQQTIYTKEFKKTKKLSKDEIIQDLRVEIAELRAENIELRILVKQLIIKVEELTIRV
ncbi:hypothetical protein [Mesoplasma melaleucae]|uniref:Uncharacterized protein n=1 Tax=Mesoplasma melaleucae TaxID=81459 RepID=A0A2K8NY15_9MOLU|nr:hypothetical protein [Mesoplasma melaleucae]ATZ17641.1 hypothetical protein EMELA_v1c00500 [Mesoplasma melaleucae]